MSSAPLPSSPAAEAQRPPPAKSRRIVGQGRVTGLERAGRSNNFAIGHLATRDIAFAQAGFKPPGLVSEDGQREPLQRPEAVEVPALKRRVLIMPLSSQAAPPPTRPEPARLACR